ncbi:hypothetical protein [Chelativorans xinjiangense]|uniref:hypothetical protein n=1 Tax=Chelativorans xinjiangense TaxID=2681485 RepID=UPI001358AAE1|nr:hypothetical protein [Chelativorans xinjiangense]
MHYVCQLSDLGVSRCFIACFQKGCSKPKPGAQSGNAQNMSTLSPILAEIVFNLRCDRIQKGSSIGGISG